MNRIGEILKSKIKPKEKSTQLVAALSNREISLKELVVFFRQANNSEKGYCMAAITQITKTEPEYIKDHLDFILDQLDGKVPRVKWEAAETVANVSRIYPDKVTRAIPSLMEFAGGEGTEIARNNPKTRKELLPFITKMAETETQSGVKKIYLKALKTLEKDK